MYKHLHIHPWPVVQTERNTKNLIVHFVIFFTEIRCFLQDSCTKEKEHLQVYLRVRPFTSAETNSGESQVKKE